MAFLYTFHKNQLRISKGNCEKMTGYIPRRRNGKMHFQTKNSRNIVTEIEGEVYNNQLWLENRDDQKAIDLLIKSHWNKILKLRSELDDLFEQVGYLEDLKGKKKRRKFYEISDKK